MFIRFEKFDHLFGIINTYLNPSLFTNETNQNDATQVKKRMAANIFESRGEEIHAACQRGDLETVNRMLLDVGEGLGVGDLLEFQDPTGSTPLHAACESGGTDLAKTLLTAGANIEAVDKLGETPLISTCLQGHDQVVEALLAAGANIEAIDGDGVTPLFAAALKGHDHVVERMMAAGARRGIQR